MRHGPVGAGRRCLQACCCSAAQLILSVSASNLVSSAHATLIEEQNLTLLQDLLATREASWGPGPKSILDGLLTSTMVAQVEEMLWAKCKLGLTCLCTSSGMGCITRCACCLDACIEPN